MIQNTKSLMKQNKTRQYRDFSPERAVKAQKEFEDELHDPGLFPALIYAPIADSASELQQCFKHAYASVPSPNTLYYKTIMKLSPHAGLNRLEVVIIGSSNKLLLKRVTTQTVLDTLGILAGNYTREPLLYSVFANTQRICDDIPSYNATDIQGSTFEFTCKTAPIVPVMMAQSLLPSYLEYDHNGDMVTYVAALTMFTENFAADTPHLIAPVLIPDVKRLQAYLAQKELAPVIIIDDKELTDPKAVLSAVKTEFVSESSLDDPLQEGITVQSGVARVPQEVKLKNYLAKLPSVIYTEE
jgi:hypothetical protein